MVDLPPLVYLVIVICSITNVAQGETKTSASSPFCGVCDCVNDDNYDYPQIVCQTDVTKYIFDSKYYFDEEANSTYEDNKYLSVQNNIILTLEKQFPASDLIVLNLANNSIVNVSDAVFANLQKMDTLILSDNYIELLHPDAFKGLYMDGDFLPLSSLKTLKLDHNRLHTLDEDIFEHTSRVEILTLSHNPLKVIDQHTLIAITSLIFLEELDLSYTQISSLPDYFLHTPKYISTLDLSGNNFDSIPQTLRESHNLLELRMNSNPITNLTKQNGFPLVKTLKILHLCQMDDLFKVDAHALSNLIGLEELHLSHNGKLAYLDKAALSDKRDGAAYETWPPLRKIFLNDNQLTTLDMHFYAKWGDLSTLDLTNNPWTCECENQWMVDELMPIYLRIDEFKAKQLRCAAPVEMSEFTFYDVHEKHSNMRCLDLYGHRPERDAYLLIGLLVGVLIAIPFILLVIYSYQRHWFGIFDSSPAAFSRQYYKRTDSSDEYF